MAVISSRDDAVKEIMSAFGLDHKSIYAFNLNIEAGDVVRVSVQFYGEDKFLGRIPAIVKRYNLTEVESVDVTKEKPKEE